MSREKRRLSGDVDDVDVFHDADFDVDDFLSTFADTGHNKHAGHRAPRQKAAWQRLDERNEVRRLREQLEDWDDWDQG